MKRILIVGALLLACVELGACARVVERPYVGGPVPGNCSIIYRNVGRQVAPGGPILLVRTPFLRCYV